MRRFGRDCPLAHIAHKPHAITMKDLTGQMLIAMPGMGDPRFDQSVIFLCAHGDDGAMGLIVNKPVPEVGFADLIRQLEITDSPNRRELRVHFGGPVETQRGFVLHSADYTAGDATLQVSPKIGLTATLDILTELAAGHGPTQAMLTLGYAGWGHGQLEDEIAQNAWLTAPMDADALFGPDNDRKWTAAMKNIGIDPLLLSGDAGHA